nr:hypothetical protein [Brevibacillus laterosporus]
MDKQVTFLYDKRLIPAIVLINDRFISQEMTRFANEALFVGLIVQHGQLTTGNHNFHTWND